MPQWPRACWLTALLLVQIGLRLVTPQIMRFFIDTATSGGAVQALLRAGLFFLVVVIASAWVAITTTYLGQNVSWTATNGLRLDLARHCLALDPTFHKAHTPGELLEDLQSP